jgi:hypothetical protein
MADGLTSIGVRARALGVGASRPDGYRHDRLVPNPQPIKLVTLLADTAATRDLVATLPVTIDLRDRFGQA